ncbi:hypothetical protein ACFWTE_14010 [Nocardiopsis sp. NPDC058631]|uniref:hypothetical protein n=1 Tax=Nocardiopsis sp. NPDC058631 TaxID=3346566 RepID=UPI003655C0BC
MTLQGGTAIALRVLVVAPRTAARVRFPEGLGLEAQPVRGLDIGTHVPADACGATGLAGVWVAGNATAPSEKVVGALACGVRAGMAINADLVAERTRRAVRARDVA